jgi:hypothetical protein
LWIFRNLPIHKNKNIMNGAHLHLILNHIPIIGGMGATLILIWGLLRKNQSIIYLAFAFFVLMGVASLGADLTGEGAEEVVEDMLPAGGEAAIHEHEEAALLANIAMMVTGLAALVALVVKKIGSTRWMPIVVLLFGIIASALMVRTGNLGGLIRHPEIAGASAAAPNGGAPEPAGGDGDNDDD